MSFDIENFRSAFPEFLDESKYTDDMLEFWSTFAEKLLNATRWGDLLTHGLYLFVAHQITLAYKDYADGTAGRAPGQSASGIVSSKSVGGASISYDTGSVSLADAGNFNSTRYGREFWQLSQLIGMGGYYV